METAEDETRSDEVMGHGLEPAGFDLQADNSQAKPDRLTGLPLEMFSRILYFSLVQAKPIILDDSSMRIATSINLKLLGVSKVLRQDGLAIFYGKNTFHVTTRLAAYVWLTSRFKRSFQRKVQHLALLMDEPILSSIAPKTRDRLFPTEYSRIMFGLGIWEVWAKEQSTRILPKLKTFHFSFQSVGLDVESPNLIRAGRRVHNLTDDVARHIMQAHVGRRGVKITIEGMEREYYRDEHGDFRIKPETKLPVQT